MKQLFDIKSEISGDEQKVLSLRLGDRHCCFAISNKSATVIYQLAYISINDWNENEWSAIFDTYPDLNSSFYEVLVAFDFAASILIPLKTMHYEDPSALLNSMYGINGTSSVISESITGWQLNNIYAVPTVLKEWIQNKFPSGRYWHQYSIGVRNSISSSTSGTLQVDLRKEDFVVIVTGNNSVLLTQTYEYSTPADLLYYLIKICNQFSLSREEVQLQLSGLIEKESALYKELYQYFIHINFRDATWNAGQDYPAHFFTALNDLAKCVS